MNTIRASQPLLGGAGSRDYAIIRNFIKGSCLEKGHFEASAFSLCLYQLLKTFQQVLISDVLGMHRYSVLQIMLLNLASR